MNSKIKWIIIDMDGTAVNYSNEPFHSSWDALAEALSKKKKKEWFDMRENYLGKRGSFYNEWFNKQVFFLKGLALKEVNRVLFPISYSKGFANFFRSVDGEYKRGIISSGIELVAKRISEEFSFDFFSANPVGISEGVFTGKGTNKIDLFSKKEELERIAEYLGFDLRGVCYVGDNNNDIPLLKRVGLPVAFEPKSQEVASAAKYSICDFMKLNEILQNEN